MELGAQANKLNIIMYNSIRRPLWNKVPLSYKYMGIGIGISNNNLVARTQLSVYELVKGTKNKNMEIGNSVSDLIRNTWGHIIYDCLIKTEYHAIR